MISAGSDLAGDDRETARDILGKAKYLIFAQISDIAPGTRVKSSFHSTSMNHLRRSWRGGWLYSFTVWFQRTVLSSHLNSLSLIWAKIG